MTADRRRSIVRRIRDRLYGAAPSRFDMVVLEQTVGARSILLYGAGRGTNEADLRAPGRRVVAVDVDSSVRRNPAVDDACLYDGVHLPFTDSVFDVCVARWVIEHVRDPQRAFDDIFRVLQPGGRFVFLTSNRWFYAFALARLVPNPLHARVVKLVLGRDEADTFPTYYRANTRRRLRRLLQATGFLERALSVELSGADYLEFSLVTYVLGVAYERVVNATPLLQDLRHAIIGVFERPAAR